MRKPSFYAILYQNMIILPRQALDEHRESASKTEAIVSGDLQPHGPAAGRSIAPLAPMSVRQTSLFAPFYTENHPFAKTGSGQT
jgi:hypothetical protein